MWIWEDKDWPHYICDAELFADRIETFFRKADRLTGRVESLPESYQEDAIIDLMLSEAIKTSLIEGETLNRDSIRSSLKVYAGFAPSSERSSDLKADGIAALMVDVRQKWNQPLSEELLCEWQFSVMQDEPYHLGMSGHYRVEEMEIVSGQYGHSVVHYGALPAAKVPEEMARFIEWYNATSPITGDESLPGPIRAGIAHVWFENIHPFDDGNGRVGRAVTDHALSQALGYPTMACLSTAIENNKKSYYRELEKIGRGSLDITHWMDFFTDSVNQAQDIAKKEVDFVVGKSRFYDRFHNEVNERQARVVARVFSEGIKGFEGGISTKKYSIIAKCSARTASRDLADLLDKGIIVQQSGSGRSTRYELATVEPAGLPGWNRDNHSHHGEKKMGELSKEEQIEEIEYRITEVFESYDPTDEFSIQNAIKSSDADLITKALDRVTELEQLFEKDMSGFSQEDLDGSDMSISAMKDRFSSRAGAIRHELQDSLISSVSNETGKNVWQANEKMDYTGEFVKDDGVFMYQQTADNTLIAHPRDRFSNPDELIGVNTTIGYFPVVRSAEQEDKGIDKALVRVKGAMVKSGV